jgi:electron transfer flavoprotein alpha subunit
MEKTCLTVAQIQESRVSDATLSAVFAANALCGGTDVLVVAEIPEAAARDAASLEGVRRVYAVALPDYPYPTAERAVAAILRCMEEAPYEYVVMPANTFGKDVLPRLAALKGASPVTDVIGIVSGDTFKRPIYAGNAVETVRVKDKIKMLTVRQANFGKAARGAGAAPVVRLEYAEEADIVRSEFLALEGPKGGRPDLAGARAVVSGGRGMGSKEAFALLERVASRIGGCAVGASRAAVDAGFAPNDMQVGQTGKIVAPDLYVAVGISGAVQHLAGMKDSKIVVAVNKDEKAPIFDVADYGLVADLFDVLPELERKLGEQG